VPGCAGQALPPLGIVVMHPLLRRRLVIHSPREREGLCVRGDAREWVASPDDEQEGIHVALLARLGRQPLQEQRSGGAGVALQGHEAIQEDDHIGLRRPGLWERAPTSAAERSAMKAAGSSSFTSMLRSGVPGRLKTCKRSRTSFIVASAPSPVTVPFWRYHVQPVCASREARISRTSEVAGPA